jgi:hypothetical protein
MVELHANSNPGMALAFKGGLARTLLRPFRDPRAVVPAILLLILLALHAWERVFRLWFWLLGLVSLSLFYWGALSMYPARLAMVGVPVGFFADAAAGAAFGYVVYGLCGIVAGTQRELTGLLGPKYIRDSGL